MWKRWFHDPITGLYTCVEEVVPQPNYRLVYMRGRGGSTTQLQACIHVWKRWFHNPITGLYICVEEVVPQPNYRLVYMCVEEVVPRPNYRLVYMRGRGGSTTQLQACIHAWKRWFHDPITGLYICVWKRWVLIGMRLTSSQSMVL